MFNLVCVKTTVYFVTWAKEGPESWCSEVETKAEAVAGDTERREHGLFVRLDSADAGLQHKHSV